AWRTCGRSGCSLKKSRRRWRRADVAETKLVTVVPHTHWDREWYEPFEVFLGRLVEMMDGLLELLDDGFPHFHLDGQAALLDDYLELRPEEEPRIRRLVQAG